jgi:predicted dehydrogenase
MRRQAKGIGLAIVGAGRVGLFRGEVAARHPAVQWIGIAEKNHNRGLHVAEKIGADFVTQDHRELLKRPEAPAPSSPPTNISTSIRSWPRSNAACRC